MRWAVGLNALGPLKDINPSPPSLGPWCKDIPLYMNPLLTPPSNCPASAAGVCDRMKGNWAAGGGDGKLGGIASGMMIDRDNSTAARNPAPELKMGRFSS